MSDPAPFDPAPFDPAPFDPAPSDPAPSDPAPSDPTPSDPVPSDPAAAASHVDAPLRLVVFDVDGTLIDSQAFILAAMRRGFDAVGRAAPPDAAILSIVGLSLPEAVRRLAPDLPGPRAEALVDAYRRAFRAQREDSGGEAASPLYPGARAALRRLAAQPATLLGVATGKARRGLDHALAAHGLDGLFQTLQTSDLHPSKPHPSMLQATLRDAGVEAGRAAMVGDSSYDMQMARSAGLFAIGVAWGYHDADALRAAGAEAVIDRFEALDAVLDARLPRDAAA
ncbi:MAG: HAD-IA family hydrolase [Pseudomonadota bacterium]